MVGAHYDAASALTACLDGYVDEVRVSSVARHGETMTPDATDNGNDGTLEGDAAIAPGGRFAKGLSLDGTGDYVEIPGDSGDTHRLCSRRIVPPGYSADRRRQFHWRQPSPEGCVRLA